VEQTQVEQTNVEQTCAEQAHVEQAHAEQTLAKAKDFMSMENPGGLLEGAGEDFGEVLRHELNNPLTGILGNAELLLAEIRRSNDGRMPPGGLQRLETIAALAVRLRETIRRLSQEWEVRNAAATKKPGA
jgi:signal transduction histidine kinase